MAYVLSNQKFQFGKILEGLAMEDVVCYLAIWSTLLLFAIFCCLLVNFMVTWYIFSCFGMLYQEKSGNPEPDYVLSVMMQSHQSQKKIRSGGKKIFLKILILMEAQKAVKAA
jgi:hypothetical protein